MNLPTGALRPRRARRIAALLSLAALASGPVSGQEPGAGEEARPDSAAAERAGIPVQSSDLGGLSLRSIGPAVMSGRIAAIDAVPGPPLTIWVGAAGGGVWRSRNAGTTFEPVFDEGPQSIGAIAVDPGDPDVVWVGTGESWVRNSVSVGRGVFRTGDGGDTWTPLGLEDTERIARIQVDPRDGATVYVCATGPLWNAGEARGVYRTRDAGETWEKVLYVDEDTGCADLALDPHAPSVLYAGMWTFRRYPWFFESGGPGSGLYRSTDGGDTWQELSDGLPPGEKGRIGIAIAPSRPGTVYAVVEADTTGLYRSDDLGSSWTRAGTGGPIGTRPFYFAHLAVDPEDPERVYKASTQLGISSDGGETFSSLNPAQLIGGRVHSDIHAIWVNPLDPHEVLLGTDGGLYMSRDRTATWLHVQSLPLSQFYEVSVDMEWPYHVYGGLQDNGTWTGPARAVGGVRNRDWRNLAAGDGFHAFVDPGDPEYVYVESQGGNVLRASRSTGEQRDIRPPAGEGEELRFNWNTPIHVSRSNPGTLYVGAQYLFRSRDRGDSWERVSPDLTTNDPEKQRQEESGGLTIDNTTAENHTTIYTISESPLDPRIVWAGTDDGNLQVSADAGASWTNVAGSVGAPPGTWVSHVEASPHSARAALVTLDGHRTGDMRAYVYRTDDLGASWTPLATDDLEGYAHVVKQDPVNPDLLFLGTESGLFLSLDGGRHWARPGAEEAGLPPVAVRDLAIHPRDHDLVIGTHGRGIWILDDLTPLRAFTAAALDDEVTMLPSRPARLSPTVFLQEFPGDAQFVGENPPEGAAIVYYQRRRHIFGDLDLEIVDADGEVVTTLEAGVRRGFNRVEWNGRHPAPELPPGSQFVFALEGPRVPDGRYETRLQKGDGTFTGHVEVGPDPRSPHSAEERRLAQETSYRLYRLIDELRYVVETAILLRDSAAARADTVDDGGLREDLEELSARAEELRAGLVAEGEGLTSAGEPRLRERLGNLFGAVSRYDGRPSTPQLELTEELAAEVEAASSDLERLIEEAVAPLEAELAERGLPPLPQLTPPGRSSPD